MDTKNIILNAAFELFEEKPINAVSMQQIADRAHVSRKTLYNHFTDKYEIMHQCYSSYVDTHILSCFNSTNYGELHERILAFIFGHRKFIKQVSVVEGADSFWSFLKDYSFRFMESASLSYTGKDTLDDREQMTLIFSIEGAIGLIRQMLEGRCSLEQDLAVEIIMERIPYIQDLEKGKEIGKEIGEIQGTIKVYDEEIHMTPSEIIRKIKTRFGLQKEEAERYVEETLELQKV